MFVKKRRGEPYRFMLIGYFFLLGNTAWYIFGTAQYFNNYLTCNPQPVKTDPIPQQNPTLDNAMQSMLWLGYLTMCKCCLYSTAVCVGVPLFCYLRRRYERPNWEAANNNVLSRLAVQKFGGLVNRDEDSTKDCVICMAEFTE